LAERQWLVRSAHSSGVPFCYNTTKSGNSHHDLMRARRINRGRQWGETARRLGPSCRSRSASLFPLLLVPHEGRQPDTILNKGGHVTT
jgi:hypothetical protein